MTTADEDERPPSNTLLIERLASKTGFDRASERLFGTEDYASYLLVVAVYIVDIPVLNGLDIILGVSDVFPLFANPALLAGLPGLLVVLYGARRIRSGFEEVVADLPGPATVAPRFRSDDEPGLVERILRRLMGLRRDGEWALEQLRSPRVTVGLVVFLWLLYIVFSISNPDAPEEMYTKNLPLFATIKAVLVIPFYLVVGADFLSAYVGVLVALPLKIRGMDLIDFRDPIGYGNLKPVGDLIGSTTRLSLYGFALYVIFAVGGTAVGDPAYTPYVGVVVTTVIAGGVALLVALFFLPVILLHGHMKDAKHRKISEISRQVREMGPDEEMFPETDIPEDATAASEYTHLFIHLTKVENTREYPIDISHIQELLLAGAVPFVAHVSSSIIFAYLGH